VQLPADRIHGQRQHADRAVQLRSKHSDGHRRFEVDRLVERFEVSIRAAVVAEREVVHPLAERGAKPKRAIALLDDKALERIVHDAVWLYGVGVFIVAVVVAFVETLLGDVGNGQLDSDLVALWIVRLYVNQVLRDVPALAVVAIEASLLAIEVKVALVKLIVEPRPVSLQ
jgi:hypothetical protein